MWIIEFLQGALLAVSFLFLLAGLCKFIGYFTARGWYTAENKTKKVCDMCFLDIKKFNKELNKLGNP